MIEQIEAHLAQAFPDAQIAVQGEGGKYLLHVTDAALTD